MKTCTPFFGQKTLIVGGVNTGKTSYTQLLLLKCRGQKIIIVLDMAPEVFKGVGGKMHVPTEPDIHYLTTHIRPPRLMGKDEQESMKIASENAAIIERDLFSKVDSIPADTLIINDVSLYLQAGNPKLLIHVLEKFPTIIMNGYLGHSFPEGPLTQRERENMKILMEFCDQVIQAEELSQVNE